MYVRVSILSQQTRVNAEEPGFYSNHQRTYYNAGGGLPSSLHFTHIARHRPHFSLPPKKKRMEASAVWGEYPSHRLLLLMK